MVLLVIKVVGVLLAAVFGVLSLISKNNEKKDDEWDDRENATAAIRGTLGKYEKNDAKKDKTNLLIFLVIMSAVGAVGASFMEDIQKQAESEEKRKHTENELKSLRDIMEAANRGLHPIREMRLTFSVNVPKDFLEATNQQSFHKGIEELIPQLDKKKRFNGIIDLDRDTWFDQDRDKLFDQDRIRSLDIIDGSNLIDLFPNEGIFRHFSIELQVYKKPVDLRKHLMIAKSGDLGPPDITAKANSSLLKDERTEGGHSIRCVISQQMKSLRTDLLIHGLMVKPDSRFWDNTGEIISVNDLRGAQVVIFLSGSNDSHAKKENEKIVEMRGKVQLESVKISVSDGRNLLLNPGRGLEKYEAADIYGYPVYSYVFPIDEKEFAKLRPDKPENNN